MQGPYPARPAHPAPLSANPPLPSVGHALHCAPGWEREERVLKANWDGVSLSAGCHGNERVGVEGLLPEPLESKECAIFWLELNSSCLPVQPTWPRSPARGGAGEPEGWAHCQPGSAWDSSRALPPCWCCSLKALEATVSPSRPGGHGDPGDT